MATRPHHDASIARHVSRFAAHRQSDQNNVLPCFDNMSDPKMPCHVQPMHSRARANVFRAGAHATLWSIAGLLAWGSLTGNAAAQQMSTTRQTEYTYNASTGLIELERVDPGGTHCVETSYQHDPFGNRQRVEVRPCATTSPSATFTPRVTLNDFEASTDAQNFYPAGAYATRSRSGTSSTTISESRASFDPRFGTSLSQTSVALADPNQNLTKRVEYDGFGRVKREYSPVVRNADGSVVETFVEYKTVYCQGPKASADVACLNFAQAVTVNYPTQRLVGPTGSPTGTATVSFISAYFVEATPYSGTTVIGAKWRVHYDSLHREIVKEAQAYDGRWIRTLTGYDQLGLSAASWGSHFVDSANPNSLPPDELKQWTAARDLTHRPVEQRQFWRGVPDVAAQEVRALVTYNGLEAQATVPSDSTPDGVARTSISRKNGAGQTAQTENADGATLTMAYDPAGNLVKTVDALGNTTTVSYTPVTARFKTGMVDPDQGSWSYAYDALGQLKTQIDARGKTITMVYDEMGRLKTKSTPAFNASWFYDKTEAGAWCAGGLNRLCESKGGNSPSVSREQLVYDTLGRAFRTITTLDRAYTTESTFDLLGRVKTLRYPTGFTVNYVYGTGANGRTPGVLEQVADNANASRIFWRIDSVTAAQVFDAQGHLLKAQLGNNVVIDNRYDSVSGKAFFLRAAGSTSVLDHRYEYDKANNLSKRTDGNTGVIENFAYDVLERLTQYALSSASDAGAAHVVTLKYNALGNILEKGDVGGYSYATTRPHAVQSAGGTSYSYDANGNILSTTGVQARTHSWTDFNLPDVLSYQGRSVAFSYDAGYKRVKEVTTSGSTVRTLYLVHPDNAGGLSFEREETRVGGGLTRNESRHYLSVGGATVVVKTLDDSGAVGSDPNLTNYWH
jgi:YD repeat-containing protein